MNAAIVLNDVTLGYDRHPAVHHASATIERGESLAIIGPNGAGKSTLLKGIAGQLQPLAGDITLHGFSRRDIAHLPQQITLERDFPLGVFDFVAAGLWRQSGAFGGLGAGAQDQIMHALSAVGLRGFERRNIGSLSRGQFQRAMFARLVLQDAPVILLDEPFTAVDAKTAADLLAVIHQWHREQRTLLTVLHDIDIARAHFPRALLLSRELIGHGASGEILSAANLFKARQLNEAFDAHAQLCEYARPA